MLRIYKSDFWSCLRVNLGSNEFKGYADFGRYPTFTISIHISKSI